MVGIVPNAVKKFWFQSIFSTIICTFSKSLGRDSQGAVGDKEEMIRFWGQKFTTRSK